MEICFISEATVLFGLKCWVRRVGGICHEYEKDASLRENVKERSQVHKSVQGFPGDSAHPSKIWQVPIGALAKKKKKKTCTVQIVIAYSCFLVKREQGCHLTEICPWSQVSTCCVVIVENPKKIVLRKNEPHWDIWNQSWRYFLLEVYHMYGDCAFNVIYVLHFWAESDVSFKSVLISFTNLIAYSFQSKRKSDNFLWVIGAFFFRAAAIRLDLD